MSLFPISFYRFCPRDMFEPEFEFAVWQQTTTKLSD